MCRQKQDAKAFKHPIICIVMTPVAHEVIRGFGESDVATPQSLTSVIPEMNFAFCAKNPTEVSQLTSLGVRVSNYI
ncbi:hypothetical protein COL77_30265 [Bacillus wiedmannii]|nr:hypothetical protein COL77_30265 [Bacillus wiedmannii]PGA83838.1 hypothetical protein COL94_19360 [Bacillus wiedmannii]PGD66147.1 hypothetical protein COM41_02250 [Bacillus wiedmannii]